MKKIFFILVFAISALLLPGCSAGTAARESTEAEETVIETTAQETAEETVVETVPGETRYIGTPEEIKNYSGEWYRLVWDQETDPKLYWITLFEDGSADFMHETRNTDPHAEYSGTWEVNEHGHVHLKLEKTGGSDDSAPAALEGNFRFLRNEADNMNIILINGDDLIESAKGSVQTFQSVRRYVGNVRLLRNPADSNAVSFEIQGEGGKWFPVTGLKSDCKFETLNGTVDLDEFISELGGYNTTCEFALNQQSLLIKVKKIIE